MIDLNKVIGHLNDCMEASIRDNTWVFVRKDIVEDAIALLKEHKNEYENGFNDAMLGKQELMYEGTDGKWHRKDW